MSSENHAPLAYHRKGNTWGGRKEDMDTHGGQIKRTLDNGQEPIKEEGEQKKGGKVEGGRGTGCKQKIDKKAT